MDCTSQKPGPLTIQLSGVQIKFYFHSDFNDLVKIGEGGSGNVYRAKWTSCNLVVALKRLDVSVEPETRDNKAFFKKLRLLQRVGFHPNIAEFYGITKDLKNNYNMVVQFANGGNLRKYLEKNLLRLQWIDKLRIAEDISCGLSFLHMSNIVHGNLHTRNILVHEERMMIADFDSLNEPEIAFIEPRFRDSSSYERDEKSDIYSLGFVLWEISSGKMPFKSKGIVHCISNREREAPAENTPHEYVKLYEFCWDEDPQSVQMLIPFMKI
ncbi:kinase-like domain-containing protein [Gigaspora rosea]|uniref:Kinase-like domain-containing protein n=1 Tax=Gigaspora rosea TaxID=44941 RepID=A0A397V4P4_9GLOM|nr:kinase-like domain-containing protein [Gigaspora rosea]